MKNDNTTKVTLRKLHQIYPMMDGIDEAWVAEYMENLYKYKCLSGMIFYKTPSSIRALCENPEKVRDLAFEIYPEKKSKILKSFNDFSAGIYQFSFTKDDCDKAIEAFHRMQSPMAALISNYSDVDDHDEIKMREMVKPKISDRTLHALLAVSTLTFVASMGGLGYQMANV